MVKNFFGALALALLGCSGSSEPAKASPTDGCEPGKSVSCACPSGDVGAQICDADGVAWGACVCGDGAAGGGSSLAGANSSAGAPSSSGGSPSSAGGAQNSAGLEQSGGSSSSAAGDNGVVACYRASPYGTQDSCDMAGLDTYYGTTCQAGCKSVSYRLPENAWCCPKR